MNHRQDFVERKLKIECKCITLTQCKENPAVIFGPGEIWQDADGVLQFKFFVIDPASYRAVSIFNRVVEIGKLIPGDQYFSLKAEEFHRPAWTSERVMFPDSRGASDCGVVYGTLSDLVNLREYDHSNPPKKDSAEAWLKGKLDFPCNRLTETKRVIGGEERNWSSSRDVAQFDHGGEFEFEFSKEGENVKVSVGVPRGYALKKLISRMQEALQFVSGGEVLVMAVEFQTNHEGQIREEIWLRSVGEHHGKTIAPPTRFSSCQCNGFWRLFSLYLDFALTDKTDMMHPLSWRIHGVIGAHAASIETEVLVLTTAVEWLAGHFPTEADTDFQRDLKVVQDAVTDAIISKKSRSRISGSLSGMKKTRNTDMLRAFITKHDLDEGFFDAWKNLRNPAAHGDGLKDRDLASTLRLKDQVLCLFYSLIFSLIGYSGRRIDYSRTKWPLANWPPDSSVPLPTAPAAATGTSP